MDDFYLAAPDSKFSQAAIPTDFKRRLTLNNICWYQFNPLPPPPNFPKLLTETEIFPEFTGNSKDKSGKT